MTATSTTRAYPTTRPSSVTTGTSALIASRKMISLTDTALHPNVQSPPGLPGCAHFGQSHRTEAQIWQCHPAENQSQNNIFARVRRHGHTVSPMSTSHPELRNDRHRNLNRASYGHFACVSLLTNRNVQSDIVKCSAPRSSCVQRGMLCPKNYDLPMLLTSDAIKRQGAW